MRGMMDVFINECMMGSVASSCMIAYYVSMIEYVSCIDIACIIVIVL